MMDDDVVTILNHRVLVWSQTFDGPLEEDAKCRHGDGGQLEVAIALLQHADGGPRIGQCVLKSSGIQDVLSNELVDLRLESISGFLQLLDGVATTQDGAKSLLDA